MFNFHGPPSSLTTRTRGSVSDINLKRVNSMGHSPGSRSSVSLPPIAKTRSLTVAPTVPHYPVRYPSQPSKKPTHREMIILTLGHVESIRGLTFDQLSSFIRGAFDLPKSSALDLKLSKTMSNMVSRGLVQKIPGLGVYDATYQLVQQSDSGLDLSVRGRSIQEVPQWPTGYTLPNGGNFTCRSAPKVENDPIELKMSPNLYRRNPHNVKLEPMPYMPVADPMICQSFGKRMGLTSQSEEPRPNSPTLSQPEGVEFDYTKGIWLPTRQHPDQSPALTPRTHVSRFNPPPQLPSSPDPQQEIITKMASNYSRVPRILDTFTEMSTLDPDNDPEDENKIYINHIEKESLGDFTGGIAHLHPEGFSEVKGQKVETLEDKLRRLSTPKTVSSGAKFKLEMLRGLQLASVGAGDSCGGGFESSQEFELNNRACHIMNDIGRHHDDNEGQGQGDQLDYLMGIANIIDSYDKKPPNLKKSGYPPANFFNSKNKTYRKF